MKIRTDFVSNSSSSSFMIVGCKVDKDQLKTRLKELNIEFDENDYYLGNLCDLLINKTDANVGHEEEITDEPYYSFIGLNYTDMDDNESKKQFEERILKEVQKMFPNATSKDIHYECQGGYNG